MRSIVKNRTSKNIVYIDESGFLANSYREYGWKRRGCKVYGERSGNRKPRTSLIAGKRGKELLAPILFEGAADSVWFNQWLKEHLFKELEPASTIVMDNAAFHKKQETRKIIKDAGHFLIFLPPYSPDFNPIEQDFAIIKKRRAFSNNNLDDIIKSYGNLLE